MWTRWRCRRCCHNMPAALYGKYGKAVAAKGEWSTGSSRSSGRKREKLEAWKPRMNSLEHELTWEKYGKTAWRSRMRMSVEENWMKREKRFRQSNERSRDCPLLQRKRRRTSRSQKRRNDLMSEHQKVQKRSKKIQSIQEKNYRKKSLAARKEMRKLREEIEWKEERFTLLSDKVDKNTMADAEMEAKLQGLQAGEERRGSNASQAVECCLKAMVETDFRHGNGSGEVQVRCSVPKDPQKIRDPYLSCANARKCQEEKKDEETVNMNKSKAETVSSWCRSCQAGSIKLHQRAVWSLIFHVYGVYLVKAEVQEDHAREVHPDRQDGLLGMRKGMTMWEIWCRKPKRKKLPGKGPRNFSRKQTGKEVPERVEAVTRS